VPAELVPREGDERLRAALERHAGASRSQRSGRTSDASGSDAAEGSPTGETAGAAPAAGSPEALKGV